MSFASFNWWSSQLTADQKKEDELKRNAENETRQQRAETLKRALMKTIEGEATKIKSPYFDGTGYYYNPTTNKIFSLNDLEKGFEHNVPWEVDQHLRKLNGLRPAT